MELKELTTERLILRPFKETDRGDLFECLSQLENDGFEGYPGITRENCAEQLKHRLGSAEYYAIELKSTGKVIGNIYCGERDFHAKEVGYIINQDFRRCGYAEEALSAVIEAVSASGIHRVYAECDPRNERSWRLLEKVGLRRETHLRQNIWFHKDAEGQQSGRIRMYTRCCRRKDRIRNCDGRLIFPVAFILRKQAN